MKRASVQNCSRPILMFTSVMLAFTAGCAKSPADTVGAYMNKGKALRAKGEYDRAILEFKNAAKVTPKDAEPYYQLGLTYIAKDDVRTAFAMLTKATELAPKHSGAQLQLATFQILGSAENKDLLKEAQSRIETVLDAKPDDAAALQLRAITEVRLGRLNEAAQDLQRALEKAPKYLASAISLANLKLLQKDVAGAETVLKSVAEAAPESADVAIALANFYVGAGRKSDAESQVQRAIKLDPKNPDALKLLAGLQMQAGNTAAAEQTYQRISALPDPSLKPLHSVFLFQQGRRDEAISELAKLAKQNPDDRDMRGMLVSAYVTANRPQEAERILGEALNRNPKDTDALLQRCAFYLDQGKFKEAELDLRSILHYKPDSAEAHHQLAIVHAARGERLRQGQELGESLRLQPTLLSARISLSETLRTKDPKTALRILEEAPEAQKNEIPYLTAKGGLLLALKDYASARRNLDAALKLARTPDLLYQDALLEFEQKNYAAVRRPIEEALKQNVENMAAVNLLAQSYAAQGDTAKALAIVQQYAQQKPGSPYLGSLVGIWQMQTQHLPDAKQTFLDVISHSLQYIPARLALAHIQMAMGNADEARRTLRELLGKEPGNRDAMSRLASIELNAGNRAAARDYYAAIVQTDSNNAEALNNLAYLLCDDKPDEALKYAQTAVELAPDAAAAQDTLGWVYYRKGIYASALNSFKAAVAKEPTAVRQYHLALAYAKVGDPQRAQEHLTAALRLDPKLPMPEPAVK